MKDNPRIEKDCAKCPQCGRTKRWLGRKFSFQYGNKCTKCGYKFNKKR